MAENAYAYYSNTFRGHAGLQVDWGEDDIGISGGMQARRGHRANNHNSKFREIGVGVVTGRNGDVGPQLVKQMVTHLNRRSQRKYHRPQGMSHYQYLQELGLQNL
jgi:hypothetical protein